MKTFRLKFKSKFKSRVPVWPVVQSRGEVLRFLKLSQNQPSKLCSWSGTACEAS